MKLKNGLPYGDIETPRVGGTAMGADNSVGKSGTEPDGGKKSMKAVDMASSKSMVDKSVLNTKGNSVGGVPMGK